MSSGKWCIKTRTGGIYGPFDGMEEAYSYLSEGTDMRKVDVRPMRDHEQAEEDL